MTGLAQYIVQTGHGGRGWEERAIIIRGAPSKCDLEKIADLMRSLDVDGHLSIRRGDDLP